MRTHPSFIAEYLPGTFWGPTESQNLERQPKRGSRPLRCPPTSRGKGDFISIAGLGGKATGQEGPKSTGKSSGVASRVPGQGAARPWVKRTVDRGDQLQEGWCPSNWPTLRLSVSVGDHPQDWKYTWAGVQVGTGFSCSWLPLRSRRKGSRFPPAGAGNPPNVQWKLPGAKMLFP